MNFSKTCGGATAAAEAASNSARHPNLLLNQTEMYEVKLKIGEQSWAERLLDLVKAKAEMDGAAVGTALAYVLTSDAKYAASARKLGKVALVGRDRLGVRPDV